MESNKDKDKDKSKKREVSKSPINKNTKASVGSSGRMGLLKEVKDAKKKVQL